MLTSPSARNRNCVRPERQGAVFCAPLYAEYIIRKSKAKIKQNFKGRRARALNLRAHAKILFNFASKNFKIKKKKIKR